MVERAHKTIQNLLKSQEIKDKRDLPNGSWDGIISAVNFAMRSTVHTTTKATPSQLVFRRDAMLNVGFLKLTGSTSKTGSRGASVRTTKGRMQAASPINTKSATRFWSSLPKDVNTQGNLNTSVLKRLARFMPMALLTSRKPPPPVELSHRCGTSET